MLPFLICFRIDNSVSYKINRYDNLRIYEETNDGIKILKETYTGNGGQSIVHKLTEMGAKFIAMRVEFTTDGSTSEKGFRLQYRRPETLFCDSFPCQLGGRCNKEYQACVCRWNFGGIFCETGKITNKRG